MMDPSLMEGIIKALMALVLITGAFIVTMRDFLSLVSMYSFQSLLLSILALALFSINGSPVLLALAALTLLSKVWLIPRAIRSVQHRMNMRRDLEFKYLSPAGCMFVTIALILLTYYSFSRFLHEMELPSLMYLGAVFGISLTLMGMLITFIRRRVVTKMIGYLTMENGVLMFGVFLTELPLIIEVLILVDLAILVLLGAMLALGMDSTIEDFQARFHPFASRKEDD